MPEIESAQSSPPLFPFPLTTETASTSPKPTLSLTLELVGLLPSRRAGNGYLELIFPSVTVTYSLAHVSAALLLLLTRVSNASNATTGAWSSVLLVTLSARLFSWPRVRPSDNDNDILEVTMQITAPKRDDGRIIIHFDYDCFYAAVFEREDPKLKSLPLAVQQKQIIVTCNYEARRRGLYKLQLVREARKKCPDVIIVLGEDLTRFRNASKDNYNFLRCYTWSNKVERLGFDEVFMDVTDMIDYNVGLLNHNDLATSFFHLDRNDPTIGFPCDASRVFGHTFPKHLDSCETAAVSMTNPSCNDFEDLFLRLRLGSHLAEHLRHQLEEQKGYTSTVGISTNKLLSKLVGNVNKPKNQTTLLPPYSSPPGVAASNVTKFIDDHDIGKVPGIGFKMAQKIRNYVLGRPAAFDAGLVYGPTKENVKVRDVRTLDRMGPELLGRLLAGAGVPKDLGEKVWGLINGVDVTEVAKAKAVPQQISIEDSYIKLDEISEVKKELAMLARSLVKRMRMDLTSTIEDDNVGMNLEEDDEEQIQTGSTVASLRWMAHPKTLRLSTRPRLALNPDGTRSRTFNRISKSTNMPKFVFSFTQGVDVIADKMVEETLVPLFHKLHPEKSGWNLSLVNLCATNMSPTASDTKDGAGRDIGRMFKKQDDMLREWKVEDVDIAPSDEDENDQRKGINDLDAGKATVAQEHTLALPSVGSEDLLEFTQETLQEDVAWDSDDDMQNLGDSCRICGAVMPPYAMLAHERFHDLPD